MAVLLVGTTGLAGSVALDHPLRLPFDPPSQTEQRAAVDAALADGRVQALLGDRFIALGVALGTEKVPGVHVSELPRLFDVWLYSYSAGVTVRVVIDAASFQVADEPTQHRDLHLPLTPVEIGRARTLALGLDDIAARFAQHAPVTANLVTGEGTRCPNQRCAMVAFLEDGRPVADQMVLVDLAADRAVGVIAGWEEARA